MIIGVAVCVGLVLIPLSMVGHTVFAILRDLRAQRRAERRRVTQLVPRFGAFSSTDNTLWTGQVCGLRVWIENPGAPPTAEQASQLEAILDDLPRLAQICRAYIDEHEQLWVSELAPERFEVDSIDIVARNAFMLGLAHPDDPDGIYRVDIRDGVPVSSVRDG